MMDYYLYFPLYIHQPEKYATWIYVSAEERIGNKLAKLMNTSADFLVTNDSGTDITASPAAQLSSGTAINVFLRRTGINLDQGNEDLKQLKVRYYAPNRIEVPEFITNYRKFSVRQILNTQLNEPVIDIASSNDHLFFLQKCQDGFKIVKTGYSFADVQIQKYSLEDGDYLGISPFQGQLLIYTNNSGYKADITDEAIKTNEIININGQIRKSNSSGTGVVLALRDRNYLYLKEENDSSTFYDRLTKDAVITGNRHIRLCDDNTIQLDSTKITLPDAEEYTIASQSVLIADIYNNLYLMIDGRLYLFDQSYRPLVSLKIDKGEKLSVDRNVFFILSRGQELHRVTVDPKIISYPPVDTAFLRFQKED